MASLPYKQSLQILIKTSNKNSNIKHQKWCFTTKCSNNLLDENGNTDTTANA